MVIAMSKKVKSQMNSTIKTMDFTWAPGPEPLNDQEHSHPRAVFIPHAKSLPFEERHVTLEQPVKIGRNVYRATPSATNTIFECRVLSRHHATLSYDKGHFYLVDNQSSNGTFINNNRCPISMEDEPHEVFSGDVVQFGISVVENAANSEKNTFPPVVALLKLYHPDGKEAKLSFNPTMTTPLNLKKLYQLNNFVQEAIQREASLESRLRTLRECVERTRAEAQASWDLFVGEQRLLMRVQTLENMLAMGKQPEMHHVTQLLDDKRNYQEVAVESLRAAHEQRLALEETLERRSREAAALHNHNCALRLTANSALSELKKLATQCERKMCAARIAIAAAEEREATVRSHLPLAYSVQNGEAKMLVLSVDNNRVQEERRGGSLEEAVRALPDYIKLLLPQHLLNKVGIKSVSADGKSAKEFELILNKNDAYNSENREKDEDDECGVSSSGDEKSASESGTKESCTDDEKLRLNHDTIEIESTTTLDGELRPDNNANSTFTDTDNRDDSPSNGQFEYANILRVMSGLNDEIKALRERLTATTSENEQLRSVRDELLTAQADTVDTTSSTVEPEDAAAYRARIADLQEQLTRSTVAEESNLSEIQRLASSSAEMQAELAFRPTRAQHDELTALVADLRAQLAPPAQYADKCVDTDDHLRTKDELDIDIVAEVIDEMFKLDYEEEEEEEETSDSVATEVELDNERKEDAEDVFETTDLEASGELSDVGDYVRLKDEERVQLTLANGSLHALEEELVRAKERWAEVCEERALLSAELTALRGKARALTAGHALLLLVPVVAACLYLLLLPYLS